MSVSPVDALRKLLRSEGMLSFPCCYDALSARLIEGAGFSMSFMSGFAVSAVKLGMPDAGLISYGEMLDQGRSICAATNLPIIGDGDTGYGNPVNVKRTVRGFAAAGFAAVMIEDQAWPKRCGHTKGKSVVSREDAIMRIRAAVDARDEGADVLVLARTDALGTHGLAEALWRAKAFSDAGADMLFVEAPTSEKEMEAICKGAPGYHLANMLNSGTTPRLSEQRLEEIGYKLVAYPFALLGPSINAMKKALVGLKGEGIVKDSVSFEQLKKDVGFDDYYREEGRYQKHSEV